LQIITITTFLAVNLISDLIMMVVAALALAASFRFNGFLDPLFAYTAGISLLFLPAGVKLLFVLIGRLPAVLGMVLMAIYLGIGVWPGRSFWEISVIGFSGVASYALSAYVVLRLLGVQQNLLNLRHWHILVLSVVAGVSNSLVHALIFTSLGLKPAELALKNAFAMTLGDFMGCFVVLMLFQWATRRVRPEPDTD
jgi:hypothetical protein